MSANQIRIQLPEAYYTLFNAKRSGKPEVIVVNEALLSFQHIEIFPWHLEVTIHAREVEQGGMPTAEESEILFAVGDRIEQAIEGTNAIFLARSTWDGLREISFRVHDPEVADATLKSLLAQKPVVRPWAYEMQADPEWNLAAYVFKLFPTASGLDG